MNLVASLESHGHGGLFRRQPHGSGNLFYIAIESHYLNEMTISNIEVNKN